MKKLGVALAIAVASVGAARAADLPTKKEAPPAPPVNCYASLWSWLDSTAADCPLSYGPFTVYGTLDGGLGWESHGGGYNAAWNNGVSNIVTKQSGPHSQWLWTPNGLSQSVVGIKGSVPLPSLSGSPLWSGWSLIGDIETGFNPFYGYLADAQRSQVQNNGRALVQQNANADSSRTGQWANSQYFIGLSNPTYGTLTVGRVYTLSLDAINSYDPMGGSYAFSPIGYSGSYAGFGDTEGARANTAVKYRLNLPYNFGLSGTSFRLGGLAQWGGYDQGNGTAGMYQGQVGGDFHLFGGSPYAGTLSMDFIGSWGKNEVNVGTFTGSCSVLTSGAFAGQVGCTDGVPRYYSNTDVTATLSNNTGLMATAKYKVQALTVYGGYAWIRQANPSDQYLNGFTTIGGWNVPATITGNKLFPTQWTNYTNYNVPRIAPFFWVGAKYAITPQIDVTGAFYWLQQADYAGAGAACVPTTTTFTQPNGNKFNFTAIGNGKCAGQTDFISALIDYRPVKRVDLYAGIMVSNVYGGLASGYQVAQTVNPTAGIRIKF
jgi:predicted porin